MSTANTDSPVYDASAQTGYALGAFFGMILLNVALAAIALILRRVTRPKDDDAGNPVELTTGKFDKRTSNVDEDVEIGLAQKSETNGKRKGKESGNAQSAANSDKSQGDKGAFDEVDLEKGDAGHQREGTESGKPNAPSGIIQHDNAAFVDVDLDKDDAVYEEPISSAGKSASVYTALSDVKPEIHGDDDTYENLTSESSKVEHNESTICY